MPDWLFSGFAYFGMVVAAVVVIGGLGIWVLSLRSEAP